MNYKEERPWGTFENLVDKDFCKVKEIIIKPNQAPSYQYHFERQEIWVLTSGVGLLTLDDEEREVSKGDIIVVPKKAKHRIRNICDHDLVFIEVQLGSYFGEDDIMRLKDDYDR